MWFTTNKNTPVSRIFNASDPDGDSLIFSIFPQPYYGTVINNFDDIFTYTPNPGFHGGDTFTYRASDDMYYSNEATVTITVINRAPVANDMSFTTYEDTPIRETLNVADPDGDPLTFFIVSEPSYGTVAIDSVRTFTYTPHPDFHGTDTFTYYAFDGMYYSVMATVTITVNPITDITNDLIITNENIPITFNVLTGTNGASPDNFEDPNAYIIEVSSPNHGTATFLSNGEITYTPNLDYYGTDSFTYTVSSNNKEETATVNIVVNRVFNSRSSSFVSSFSQNLLNNTANVSGNTEGGPLSANITLQTPISTINNITITKSSRVTSNMIQYQIIVTNTGETNITDVNIQDENPIFNQTLCQPSLPRTLQPEENSTCYYEQTL